MYTHILTTIRKKGAGEQKKKNEIIIMIRFNGYESLISFGGQTLHYQLSPVINLIDGQ